MNILNSVILFLDFCFIPFQFCLFISAIPMMLDHFVNPSFNFYARRYDNFSVFSESVNIWIFLRILISSLLSMFTCGDKDPVCSLILLLELIVGTPFPLKIWGPRCCFSCEVRKQRTWATTSSFRSKLKLEVVVVSYHNTSFVLRIIQGLVSAYIFLFPFLTLLWNCFRCSWPYDCPYVCLSLTWPPSSRSLLCKPSLHFLSQNTPFSLFLW